jgi:hypothetical protein
MTQVSIAHTFERKADITTLNEELQLALSSLRTDSAALSELGLSSDDISEIHFTVTENRGGFTGAEILITIAISVGAPIAAEGLSTLWKSKIWPRINELVGKAHDPDSNA